VRLFCDLQKDEFKFISFGTNKKPGLAIGDEKYALWDFHPRSLTGLAPTRHAILDLVISRVADL